MKKQRLDYHLDANRDDETTLVITFLSLIHGGFCEGQTALAETAARQCGVPLRYALAILRRYTGSDYRNHYWKIRDGSQVQHLFELLPPNCNLAGA